LACPRGRVLLGVKVKDRRACRCQKRGGNKKREKGEETDMFSNKSGSGWTAQGRL